MKTINPNSTRLCTGLLSVCIFVLFCSNCLYALTPDELYAKGSEAYAKDKYLEAVEYFFAYKQVSASTIEADKAFKKEFEEGLKYCEDQIQLAIDTKRQLDRFGQVTEVTVTESSGKADDPSKGTKRNYPFRAPHSGGPKPGLPSKAAQPRKQGIVIPASEIRVLGKARVSQIAPNDQKPRGNDKKLGEENEDIKEKYQSLKRRCETLEQENETLEQSNKTLTQKAGTIEKRFSGTQTAYMLGNAKLRILNTLLPIFLVLNVSDAQRTEIHNQYINALTESRKSSNIRNIRSSSREIEQALEKSLTRILTKEQHQQLLEIRKKEAAADAQSQRSRRRSRPTQDSK